jgi:integrase
MLEARPKTGLFVLTSKRGEALSQTAFRRRWEPIQRRLSFRCGFHMLRHCYATSLNKLGVDIKTAQTFLGHSRANTTLDVYMNTQDFQRNIAAQKIDGILEVGKKSV